MAEELISKGTVCAHTDTVAAMATPVDKSIPIETVTKISDLPVNLVEEILSWVPLKSMRAVRLTCKQWHSLSKSQSFSKMHIDKTRSRESMMVALKDYSLYLMDVVLVVTENPLIEHKDDDTKVIVWNPYLGQTRSIEYKFKYEWERFTYQWDKFSYAFGYDEDKGSLRRSYKFLMFIDSFSWYEIYDFDSGSWKALEFDRPHWRIRFGLLGASLRGNTYLPSSQRDAEVDNYIICFDFRSESFGPLLRLPFDAGVDDYVSLSCVGEEKLAALLTHNERGPLEFEIWISTEIESGEVLWSKFLRVETETGFYALVNCESFVIDEEKKVAMGYGKTFNIVGEDVYSKELELIERVGGDVNHCKPMVCSYVPSLVQIMQEEVKGNNEATDQNMSRLAAIENVAVCDTLQKEEGKKTR